MCHVCECVCVCVYVCVCVCTQCEQCYSNRMYQGEEHGRFFCLQSRCNLNTKNESMMLRSIKQGQGPSLNKLQ